MLLSEVGYARPATLEQALGVLGDNLGARALAGGQTLINVMKARAAAPDVLVDLAGIAGLKGIELGSDGTLEVGPPRPVFGGKPVPDGPFDITRDGKRLLLAVSVDGDVAPRVHLVTNWMQALDLQGERQ